jgi:hypothetical protein
MSGLTDAQILELHGGKAWEALVASSWTGFIIHGEKLVMMAGELGVSDNVDRMRQTLMAAERLGLIARRKYRPSAQQQFFGSNSQFGSAVLDPAKTNEDATLYDWEFLPTSAPKKKRRPVTLSWIW